jgi:two-component system, NtrC family, sensor kinase
MPELSRSKIRLGIAAKLAICMVAGSAAFFALFGYINIREQKQHSEELILQSAERVSDIVLRSTRYQMLHNDRLALYQAITDIGSEPGIRRIRIFNKEGRITFSTDAAEVNRVVDKRAEACYGCHAREAPLKRLARPDRARIFKDAGGRRVLGVIRPIYNQPACSDAACHSHRPDQQVLGVIDANLSLDFVDAQAGEHQAHLVYSTGAAGLAASLLSIAFIFVVVYRPVTDLTAGTHRVAGGDLNYRLPVHSDDELGELAESFNAMTEQLAAAHAEITDWTRTLEERVQKKTVELERAHSSLLASEKLASIGKLAATVAHEVNNPLFGILTYARLTRKEAESSELDAPRKQQMVEQLQIIERESRRCGDIMRNLLTFARQAPSHREPNDLNTPIERAVALVRHRLDLQGIELKLALATGLPPANCDTSQMQQAILVLLVNAAEAMSEGGVLTVETTAAGEDSVAIRVRDTGSGIPAEVLPQIFEPFFTTKEDQQRTGLGLAVARSIIEQHGGRIEVCSTPGQGTEFVVTLPAEAGAGAKCVETAALGGLP